MGVGERSAKEPTPVFDAVVAMVRAAGRAQEPDEGEGQDTGQAEVATAI